ncbi:SxtJ family membrane protein [Actomonas aquatica]|uniref:SxtJ family membrane protein n=1 Tax=Actomonas aquatica TaxID=2866162 RepID=A0ABZ1CAX1_9BACT|nr:SxtJ family membrane protein [Opitutus sp. WL0086]WRQ88826.1 SxtJ family membrane protein [Opitutus sp. WL0086]
MSLIKINRHPSPKDLRVFATLWLLFLGVFGFVAQHRGASNLAWTLWSLAGLVGALGWIVPPAVRWVYLAAIYITSPIGFVLSHVILGLVYYLVLTPIGLIMRALGRDPLERRYDPTQTSYWKPRAGQRPPASYLKQH